MRPLVVLIALASTARADDGTTATSTGATSATSSDAASVGASVAAGAGAEGTAAYGALELRLDVDWRGARLGLAARAVWLDGTYRHDYRRAADAVTLVRYLELGG